MTAAVASYVLLPDVLPEVVRGKHGVLRIPPNIHTLSGFRRWAHSSSLPEKLRIHYIRGDIYLDMTRESIQTHVLVKTAVVGALFKIMEDEDLGEFYGEGIMLTNKAARVSTNPDAAAVMWATIESNRVRYFTKDDKELELQGTPDWVMEVVSDSSVQKDTKRLRRAYHAAGIPEYWLIDARGQAIDFELLQWRKSGYVAAAQSKDGWRRSRIFGHDFQLVRRRNRRGAWHYTLRVKP
jgi:Uma2 family endonuclease